MKIENLKPGMIVYDVHRYKMGNTTISTVGVWEVEIVAVGLASQIVVAKWNHNQERKYWRGHWSKWRAKKPLLIKLGFGHYRLANREEIKAAKGK